VQAPSSRVLVRMQKVLAKCGGITASTLHRYRQLGGFPEPIILNPGAKNPHIAWYEDEVDGWIASRPRGNGRAMAPEVYERHAKRHRGAAASPRHVMPRGRVALLSVEERDRRRAEVAQRADASK
jgi:predicted DNA-binding transcriptional regulator AlpA